MRKMNPECSSGFYKGAGSVFLRVKEIKGVVDPPWYAKSCGHENLIHHEISDMICK